MLRDEIKKNNTIKKIKINCDKIIKLTTYFLIFYKENTFLKAEEREKKKEKKTLTELHYIRASDTRRIIVKKASEML
jgi:hypothetical protein